MKLMAQEEVGLRCMVQMARAAAANPTGGSTIGEIAAREALTSYYVAKLMRLLRLSGLVVSVRGQKGGYRLARPATEISVAAVLAVLGARFHTVELCRQPHPRPPCVHADDCAIRPLWSRIDQMAQSLLDQCTIADLVAGERAVARRVRRWVSASNRRR